MKSLYRDNFIPEPKIAKLLKIRKNIDQLEMENDIKSVSDIERLDNQMIKVLGVEDEVESKKLIGLIDSEVEQLDAGYRTLRGTLKVQFPCPTGCFYYCSALITNANGAFGKCNCCRCAWYEWIWVSAVLCTVQEINYALLKSKGVLIQTCEKPYETNCGSPLVKTNQSWGRADDFLLRES